MAPIIKQAGYFLVSSLVLDISLHATAAVYSYGSDSYTSGPNSPCAQAQLPRVSGHQGSDYHLNIRSLNVSDERVNVKPKRKKRTEESGKQEKKANRPSKNENSTRAKKQ